MKIECPNCNFTGNIDESKLPDHRIEMKCPKCQVPFEFKVPDDNEKTISESLQQETHENNATDVLPVHPKELNYPIELYSHKLFSEAKKELIFMIHSSQSLPETVAASLFWLGHISLEEQNNSAAFDDWNRLRSNFPESEYSIYIEDKLEILKTLITDEAGSNFDTIISKAYLNNGDFWSKDETEFIILVDTSLHYPINNALYWYDKIINDYPGKSISELAYLRKFQVHFRSKISPHHFLYSARAIDLFNKYESDFPNGKYLQVFSFLVAQGYGSNVVRTSYTYETECANNAVNWFNKSISYANDCDNFYSVTAKAAISTILAHKDKCSVK